MTLRLDPHRPIVWRTPNSLQIGVDPVLAVLDDVSDADARLLDSLVVGVTRAGFGMLADRAGVTTDRVEQLLGAAAPALLPASPAPAPRAALAVVGTGIGAQRVAAVLREAGHRAPLSAPAAPDFDADSSQARGRRPAAAVLVSTHVIEPREHLRWLRRDVPHLPIVFGEVAVTVGPLVLPGESACLACVEQQRTLADPARPAIAAQLWGTAAAAESPALATEAAVDALRMLRAGIPTLKTEAAPSPAGRGAASVRIDAESGARVTHEWWPAEHCGCRGLSLLPEPALRRGTGSAPARRAPRSPVAPTTVPAPFALA